MECEQDKRAKIILGILLGIISIITPDYSRAHLGFEPELFFTSLGVFFCVVVGIIISLVQTHSLQRELRTETLENGGTRKTKKINIWKLLFFVGLAVFLALIVIARIPLSGNNATPSDYAKILLLVFIPVFPLITGLATSYFIGKKLLIGKRPKLVYLVMPLIVTAILLIGAILCFILVISVAF